MYYEQEGNLSKFRYLYCYAKFSICNIIFKLLCRFYLCNEADGNRVVAKWWEA